ncbi:MAG: (deoxy)nucleoside triphosphate pyrophosphohydrolase [Lentisphaeria bacterium]
MNCPLEVCAAVIFHGGRLLLATRRPGGHLAGKWEFPGGKVKAGETLVACINRELQEELGLPVQQASLLFDVQHHYPEKTIHLHFLLCEIDSDKAVHPREGQLVAWFQADQLPLQNMVPADRIAIEHIRRSNWMTQDEYSEAPDTELPVLRNPVLTGLLQDWLRK